MTFNKEDRYLVFKRKDLSCLNTAERDMLAMISNKVDHGRAMEGKDPLHCVVVESDWPEYGPTWDAIEARVAEEQDNG